MLQELAITPATVAVLLAISALTFLAVRRMFRKGLCDCGEKCSSCEGCAKAAGCGSGKAGECSAVVHKDGKRFVAAHKAGECPAVSHMARSIESALK